MSIEQREGRPVVTNLLPVSADAVDNMLKNYMKIPQKKGVSRLWVRGEPSFKPPTQHWLSVNQPVLYDAIIATTSNDGPGFSLDDYMMGAEASNGALIYQAETVGGIPPKLEKADMIAYNKALLGGAVGEDLNAQQKLKVAAIADEQRYELMFLEPELIRAFKELIKIFDAGSEYVRNNFTGNMGKISINILAGMIYVHGAFKAKRNEAWQRSILS